MLLSPKFYDISNLGQTNNFLSPNKSGEFPDYFITSSIQLRSYEQQEFGNLSVIEQLEAFPANSSDVHITPLELGPELLHWLPEEYPDPP